ncbi:MAG: PilW family protein [Minisyncoccia bacterium]
MEIIKSKGFTIAESLVVILMFSLVFIALLELYLAGQKLYLKGENRAEILQNGRIILERLSRELRQAKEIVTPLPQIKDNENFPPPSEIEFEDGHYPSPYQNLGANYYYVRYYFVSSTKEIRRQYLVYCFEDCNVCQSYFKWNDKKEKNGNLILPKPCVLEEKTVGEYVENISFWGDSLIHILLSLKKVDEKIDLKTAIFARNL